MLSHITEQLSLNMSLSKPVEIGFDGPDISSDSGVLLFSQLDKKLGFCEQFAAILPDERKQEDVLHTRLEQTRQRIFQIMMGYEDQNDANSLRHDPALKIACGQAPLSGEVLSSQSTFSLYENAATMASNRELMLWFEQSYVDSLPSDTKVVFLDVDGTEDRAYGQQQLTFFNAHYDSYMYFPLLIFDGITGQLVTALLRPGNKLDPVGAIYVLGRIIKLLKERFPDVDIVIRGDSKFSVPRIHEYLDRQEEKFGGIEYLLGQATNPRLKKLAAPFVQKARIEYLTTGKKSRVYGEIEYAAKSWKKKRRVLIRVLYNSQGEDVRFVVTSIKGFKAGWLYCGYCERGDAENRIKDFKNALAGDRLSCGTFVANFFRLLLHAGAYRLMFALREEAKEVKPGLGRMQFDTLRLNLLKVAGIVRESVRRIWVELPKAFPLANVFRQLCIRLNPPPLRA